MSSSGSDWTSLREDRSLNTSVPLLVSISEITAAVASIEFENHDFGEIESYFYRVSIVIMELQTAENYNSTSTMNILHSLYKNIGFAKELVSKLQNSARESMHIELGRISKQLEEVVKLIGEDLSSVSTTLEDHEYVNIAVRALSKEMQSFQIEGTHFQTPEERELEPLVFAGGDMGKQEPVQIDTDLYSINYEVSEFITQSSVTTHLYQAKQVGSRNSRSQMSNRSDLSPHMEPLYDTFFCPLTKRIMEDPVTIESGVTYERKAITAWYKKFKNPDDINCPKTGQKIMSRILNTNIALKATIEEWRKRDELARIEGAMSTLSHVSTDRMIFEALTDLGGICSGKHSNRVHLLGMGILPLLAKFLEYKDRNVRCGTLELLLQLIEDEDEDETKEMVAATIHMPTIIKMLSSKHSPIRHTTLQLLLELSQSKSLCQKIGYVNGGILMLITMKYKQSSDAFASERADQILGNLVSFPENIKSMAENGYLEPLLDHLVAGTEETQMEMTSYLGEITLGHDSKIQVAERASPALIKMLQSGNSLTRKAAFHALKQISSYHLNSGLLIRAGIVRPMVEEIFMRAIQNEPMNSNNESAAILANIFESGTEIGSLFQGLRMSLKEIAYKFISLLHNSTPNELNINLIRILLCLTKSPTSSGIIVSVIKETEASYNLIELINNPFEELQIAALKLLISLTPYMGHTLADRLCKTQVQPESLIQIPNEKTLISEKQAVSASFLAKLPHQNLTLNLALINKKIVPTVLQAIGQTERSGMKTSRYKSSYLEGLVGILVRFTRTLYDNQALLLARTYNFTSVFTELLTTTSSDEVQRLSANGLENLSAQSITLSKLPTVRKPKYIYFSFLPKCGSFKSSNYNKVPLCPVHRGACSSQDTFCLLEANAVERLLACLDHENVGVVEAALSAICTLLDDKVDVDKSISILTEARIVQRVLNVVREHKEEALRKKSFWAIERFLIKGGDKSASDISQDRSLSAALVNAFHHGDGNTRQMAENILMNLNKMPDFTTNFTM